ncbi:MAG: hypothetical protein LBG77_04595 [Dysgonamonadaceae bacterium]|nr:hypothetical protein [Dysgonamonadaceae bacterium]
MNTKVPEPTQKEGQSKEDFEKEKREYADFILEKVMYAADLERERVQKIEKIRQSEYEKQLQDFEKGLSKQYGADLAAFTDNEAEKNRIEQEMQQERSDNAMEVLEKEFEKRRLEIAKNSEALADAGGIGIDEKTMQAINDLEAEYNRRKNEQIAKDNAAARALENQAIQLQLNRDLIAAGEDSEAQYNAKKEALQKELELYKDNADKQAKIHRDLANLEREITLQRIAQFEEWSGRTMEIMSAISSLAAANEEAELQRYEEGNDQKKESLQQRLDSGLISQEEYDKGVADADAELDKKQKEIARQQAAREKALQVFQIAINTAAAIMKNTAQLGLAPAIPVNIATAVLGAVQLAAVLAKPLPKASKGALLKGASHAAGGIMIEAEGGEAIINKRSTAMFAPLLSAINQAGGGVPFASAYSDGGYRMRAVNNTSGGLSEKQMERAMERAVTKQKIYLTVEDYRKADANYIEINDSSDTKK